MVLMKLGLDKTGASLRVMEEESLCETVSKGQLKGMLPLWEIATRKGLSHCFDPSGMADKTVGMQFLYSLVKDLAGLFAGPDASVA